MERLFIEISAEIDGSSVPLQPNLKEGTPEPSRQSEPPAKAHTTSSPSRWQQQTLAPDDAPPFHSLPASLVLLVLSKELSNSRNTELTLKLVESEFDEVVLPGIVAPLKALQSRSFGGWQPAMSLFNHRSDQHPTAPIDPPLPSYAMSYSSEGNLVNLARESDARFLFDRFDRSGTNAQEQEAAFDYVVEHRQLDVSQARAILHSLRRQVSLVNGPPGTGKSFFASTLGDIITRTSKTFPTGPILFVAQTNATVDKGAEFFLDAGMHISRIGMSGKSARVRTYGLNRQMRAFEIAYPAKRQWRVKEEELKREVERRSIFISESHASLHKIGTASHLWQHLRISQPTDCEKVFGIDVHTEATALVKLQAWIADGQPTAPAQNYCTDRRWLYTKSLANLNQHQRQCLVAFWRNDMHDQVFKQLSTQLQLADIAHNAWEDHLNERKALLLQQCDVITMTTTGAAMHVNLIDKHQNRPMVQDIRFEYDRGGDASAYALDVSIFERAVNPDLSCKLFSTTLTFTSLEVNRRYHPDLSVLPRSTFYPDLEDAEVTKAIPFPAWLASRFLMWKQVIWPEKRVGTSMINTGEAQMVKNALLFITKQQDPGSVAVITGYSAQSEYLKGEYERATATTASRADPRFDGDGDGRSALQSYPVDSDIIDGLQGKEADGVILSSVRTRNIGFWQDPRRSNVAMTLVKQATLIIGDVRPILGTEYWDTVESLLRSENNLSSRLTLKCPRHPNHEIRVESANLISAPSCTLQGGCTLRRCKRVLTCGDKCNKLGHSDRECNAAPA